VQASTAPTPRLSTARAQAGSPRVGLVVEQRYLSQLQPSGLAAALTARGCGVVTVDPDELSFEVRRDGGLEELDVVVARGRSTALFSLLAWAEHRGLPTINRRQAVAAVYNKVEMALALASDGVAIPRTWIGAPKTLAGRVPRETYPLILKPAFGDNCRGLREVESPAELDRVDWPEPTALVQRYVPSGGVDLKLYGIGERVWAVRKPSPLGESNASAEPARLTPAMAAIARRCSRLFGLELYGVDCVETDQGPVVIEVNEFPNYTGVADANERLADHVLRSTPGSWER